MATSVDDKLDLILAETRAVAAAQDSQVKMLGLVLACLEAVPPRPDTHTEILRRLLEAATEDGGDELSALLARFERLLSDQLAEIRAMRQGVGALDRSKVIWPQTPVCYAMTVWRRTESGSLAASIRFSTATPIAASVCWAAKPRARSRGPISAL